MVGLFIAKAERAECAEMIRRRSSWMMRYYHQTATSLVINILFITLAHDNDSNDSLYSFHFTQITISKAWNEWKTLLLTHRVESPIITVVNNTTQLIKSVEFFWWTGPDSRCFSSSPSRMLLVLDVTGATTIVLKQAVMSSVALMNGQSCVPPPPPPAYQLWVSLKASVSWPGSVDQDQPRLQMTAVADLEHWEEEPGQQSARVLEISATSQPVPRCNIFNIALSYIYSLSALIKYFKYKLLLLLFSHAKALQSWVEGASTTRS